MILELDVGNTRIKWRLLVSNSGAIAGQGSVGDLAALAAAIDHGEVPTMVRMCSVRSSDVNADIEQWVNKTWQLNLHTAQVTRHCAGVTNQYSDQSKLGVDRWLAMLAAFNKCDGGCIVVDSGTALTIDVVDAQGLHLGGYIVPGLALLRSSLENKTRIRLGPVPPAPALTPGNSTDGAVCNGTLLALTSLIDKVFHTVRTEDAAVAVYFTGGDAALLADQVDIDDALIMPGLVLDGLALACPTHE